MGSSKGFEYTIHLSVSADDFTPDIQKILKNVQTQADKNQVKLTLSGDPKDLLKQLIDIKKQIPTLDLTDGMYVGLAEGIEQDTEKGKKLIDNFTTYIINSVQEAVSSISNLTEAISNTEETISRLRSRRGQLFNDKDITNAAQAFEKAQERLYNASNAYSTSKQKGKKQQAVLDMQTAYQDILNIQSQAGQQISERTKTILDGIALETVEVFKSLTGEEMKLNEMFAKMKPNSSYVEMIQTLDSEIFAAENHLTDLKRQLENAKNPQLKVKGQLTDDFLTDLQSQLDKLQGLEVKVKPVVDKDVKLEVETAVDVKPTKESKIELPKVAENLADALQRTQPEVYNLIESEKKVLEAPGETPNTSGLDKINKSLDNVQEKAEKTAESIGRIYLSQTGDANSGNYAYTRLADSKNLAEYYKGVVTTDDEGNVQSGEVRLVNYTKLLNELLKYDKELFQIEQEINKAENDPSVIRALNAKKSLVESQREPYEDLLNFMRQRDEYLINGNREEINYINQRRDAQKAELQAEQNIKQARIDSSNQSKAIQEEEAQRQERIDAIMKRREQYLTKELEYRKLIAKANPTEDKNQIQSWSQKEKQYRTLYEGESHRLKNLDAEIAKEQELNTLNKIKIDYEEQIASIQANKTDKSRNAEAKQQNKLAEEAVKIYEKLQKYRVDAEKLSIGKASQEELKNANDLVEELTKKYKALIEQMKKLDISFSNEQQFKINQAGADAQQAIDKIRKNNAPKEETEKNDASSRNQIIKNYIDLQKEQIRIQEQINMLEQSGVSSDNKRIVNRRNQLVTLTTEINDAKKAYEQLIPTEAEEARVRQSVDSAKRKYTNQTLDDLDREEKKIQSLNKKYISLKQQIESWLISNPKADKVFGNQLREYIHQLNTESEKTPEKLAQIEQGFRNIKNEAAKTGATGKSFFDLLSNRWQSLFAYLGSFTSFYRIIGGIKQAFSTIRDLDTQLVDLRKTTKMNLTELNQFYLSANDIAQAMGVTTKEIISQAAAWSRLNKIGPLCSNI